MHDNGIRMTADLERRCDLLRSLHVPGAPLVLPNAWDVASAREVVAAGFPVVATTSGGIAATLGYRDHEGAPGHTMLAAAARIIRSVDVPVTIDVEAGYGMEPDDLVRTLMTIRAAGCNLEDANHADGRLYDTLRHAAWLRAVRDAASDHDYPLVINARTDVFLAHRNNGPQRRHVRAALDRVGAYADAGADCIFPIALWEEDALAAFVSTAPRPVNVLASPRSPSPARLAELGVARISHGSIIHRQTMVRLQQALAALTPETESVAP